MRIHWETHCLNSTAIEEAARGIDMLISVDFPSSARRKPRPRPPSASHASSPPPSAPKTAPLRCRDRPQPGPSTCAPMTPRATLPSSS